MGRRPLALFLALAAAAGLRGGEPAPDPQPRIGELVRQLGSEVYAEREAACEQLKKAGAQAREALEAAARSDDVEVSLRAQQLLPYARAAAFQALWKEEMARRWIPALRAGEVGHFTLGRGAPDQPAPSADGVPQPQPGLQEATHEGFLGDWLSRAQEPDGRWDSLKWGATCAADAEQTALVLLAILGAGHSEKVGRYKDTIRRAVGWLSRQQRADGAILSPGWEVVDGVTHALAGLALAEAAGMARVPSTISAAQLAVDYSEERHQSRTGDAPNGFGRLARTETPDLFTSAFFTMQLKSAKVGGLRVRAESFQGLIRFLDSVDGQKTGQGVGFSYLPGGKATPEATFMGCLARQFLGWKREDLLAQVAWAKEQFKGPTSGQAESDGVVNWFGTLCCFQHGGELWKSWNEKMRKSLLEVQLKSGPGDGSWEPAGRWGGGGRVLITSLNAICLGVYYRYLPVYKE